MLKGLALPPRGSSKDIYLQSVLVQQHEQQFDMCYSVVQAILAANAEGDGRVKLFTDLQNTIANVVNKLFPYNKKKPLSVDKTQDDLRMLKRFMNANNYNIKTEEK